MPVSVLFFALVFPPNDLIAAGGHSASYTDVDGDHVTVKVTGIATGSGVFTPGLFTTVSPSSAIAARHSALINIPDERARQACTYVQFLASRFDADGGSGSSR